MQAIHVEPCLSIITLVASKHTQLKLCTRTVVLLLHDNVQLCFSAIRVVQVFIMSFNTSNSFTQSLYIYINITVFFRRESSRSQKDNKSVSITCGGFIWLVGKTHRSVHDLFFPTYYKLLYRLLQNQILSDKNYGSLKRVLLLVVLVSACINYLPFLNFAEAFLLINSIHDIDLIFDNTITTF